MTTLQAYDLETKIKTNPTSILIGMLNIKAEVKIFDKFSIEPTATLTRYNDNDFDILTGLNFYLYLNSVMNSEGFFISTGMSKGINYKDEFYSSTLGYQWYYNATGIRYTSIELGAMYKKDLVEEDHMLIPVIYFNIAF